MEAPPPSLKWRGDSRETSSASVNLPKHVAGALPAFSYAGPIFQELDWKKKKRQNSELGSGFGRFLAAKIEFSYGAGQTVNLLALRLQWFESTPTQASPLQVFKPFGGQLGISSGPSGS